MAKHGCSVSGAIACMSMENKEFALSTASALQRIGEVEGKAVDFTIERACGPPIRRLEHVCFGYLPNMASLFAPSSPFVSLACIWL